MKRRKFIKMTGTGSLAASAVPVILADSRWRGANDRVNIAVIGIRGMGQSHIRAYQELDNVEVIHQRVEDYQPIVDGHRIYFDVITARAYATTDDILSSTAHLQTADTCILVMQGKQDKQIDSNQYKLIDSHALDVYGLDAERRLLEIKRHSA